MSAAAKTKIEVTKYGKTLSAENLANYLVIASIKGDLPQ